MAAVAGDASRATGAQRGERMAPSAMLFAPAPPIPASGRSRLGFIARVAFPCAALVVVVAVAVAGPRAALRNVPALGNATPTAPAGPVLADAAVPAEVLGLSVLTVEAVVDASTTSAARSARVAVAGWLTLDDSVGRCVVTAMNVRCTHTGHLRSTELAQVPDGHVGRPVAASAELDPVFAPGMLLPGIPAITSGALNEDPVAVVLVGRLLGPAAGSCWHRSCPPAFAVERVAWSAGAWREPGPG